MFCKKPSLSLFTFACFTILFINVKTYAQNDWQQRLDYQINVSLNDSSHQLNGNIKIVYHNNSSVTLNEIWMHVWPNAYKNDKSAFAIQHLENNDIKFHYADDSKRGYIDSLNFLVDGEKVLVVENENFPDIQKLILNEGLAPNDSIIITTPFRVKLPNSFSRLGHVDQSYQISQWYPKPAVFDQRGWHPIPYLDQGEFYSEYGKFDVKITLPLNYVVGATGELQNKSELAFLDSLSNVTREIKTFSKKSDFPGSANGLKTLHYIQNNIHDFAWFADKRFHVLASEVELPESKRKVKTYVMFTNDNANYWKQADTFINNAIYYYSLWNGDYPYNYCTAVDGALSAGGGMEYPMVTVIGDVGSAKTLDRVIAHEVGHNWFYGIIGSNEREYGWMDEGINSFYENRYMRVRYGDEFMINKKKQNGLTNFFGLNFFPVDYDQYLTYQLSASQGEAQAINTHSEKFTYLNYGVVMYTKTSLVLRYLEQYLGVEKFDSIMHQYYVTWKFKHPYPEDIQAVFESETREKLDWFFKDIIQNKNDIDFEASQIRKENNQIRVKISNNTDIAGPAFVSSYDKKGNLLESYKTQAFYGATYVYFDNLSAKKIVVDPLYIIPETNRSNNTIKTRGLLKKTEPLHLQMLAGITRPDKTNLFFTPALGYNTSDGLLGGIAFYNNVFPFKNTEWVLLPMYGFKSEKLNGTGEITHRSYPVKVSEIATTFSFNSFSTVNEIYELTNSSLYERFFKLSLGTEVTLKPKTERSKIKNKLSYRFVFTSEDITSISNNSTFLSILQIRTPNSYHQFKYVRYNRRVINPNSFSILYEYANNMINTYNGFFNLPDIFKTPDQHHKIFAVYKQKLNYSNSKKGVQFRVFAGTIFTNTNRINQSNFFSISGNNDYTYDKAFFNRYDIYRRQFHESDGAFKSNTFSGTVKSLAGINVKAPLKSKFPIGLFADFAFANFEYIDIETNKIVSNIDDVFDFGIYVPIINDVFEIYFPILYEQRSFNTKKYTEVIRLMIDFQAIQPLNLRRSLQLF